MILLDRSARPLIAHRGASGDYPENTILAFERGLSFGADAIELDVRLSADAVPVVIHDRDLDRTTDGSGPVGRHTVEELSQFDAGSGERIPTLDSVLGKFPTVPLIIELKEARVARPVVELIGRHGAAGRVLVGSFEQDALAPFNAPGFCRAASRRETARFWLGSHLAWAPRGRSYHAFTVPEMHGRLKVVDEAFVRWAYRRSKPVHVWTVNDLAEAQRLRNMGVQGIMTDFPERMRKLSA
ncbi:MAG: glycerophosphodiester phosphodiesterase [Gemmatimonadota bacterium]|nr:MAG: glycerophosphodiester phosphodiesterase [Gemmatimonadota bacterium]